MGPTIAEMMDSVEVRDMLAAIGADRFVSDLGVKRADVDWLRRHALQVSSVDALVELVTCEEPATLPAWLSACAPAAVLALVDGAALVDPDAAVVVGLFDDVDVARATVVTCASYSERYFALSAGWKVVLLGLVAGLDVDGRFARFVVATGASVMSSLQPRRCRRRVPGAGRSRWPRVTD